MSTDAAIAQAVSDALEPYLRRIETALAAPEVLAVNTTRAADMLGCEASHVRRLAREGVLATVPHMGRRVLITVDSLRALAGGVGADEITARRAS